MRPTESELWETLDLPASQAGGGNTWMPRRIERGASTRHAHEQMSFPFPGVCCLFLVCFFFGVLKAERDELCNAMSIRYGAHRSTGFAARFQPIDRGNRELGGHGKAQTLAGDWAVQARSPAGSLVGACCGAQHAEMHANVPSMYVWGMVRCAVGGDVKQAISNGWTLGIRATAASASTLALVFSSHFLSARPSVRPSTAVVVAVVEATGHVTDGVQQHSTRSTHSRPPSTTGQARPVK